MIGHKSLDFQQNEQEKKKLLLQRFQEENPNFDFSNAEINGNVPDARTFINGLDYNKK